MLCRGDSGSAQVIHKRCLTGAWRDVVASIYCLLTGCLLSERARGSFLPAGDNACQV